MQNAAELNAVLKLRFNGFNLKLGEGLKASYLTQRDLDEFDRSCQHLIVVDRKNDEVIGTYHRMQTGDMAAAGNEFYSAGEFDLTRLPDEVVKNSAVIPNLAGIWRQDLRPAGN